jgi:NAD(P)-dependent dehydrogenase (short-subunit alcohol dehydrogenase family)/acyl carrier protein
LTHDPEDPTSSKIRKIRDVEALGANVLILKADAANEEQMQTVVKQATEKFGQINGVIHAAGVADYAGVIQRRTRETTEAALAPKLQGTIVLESVLQNVKLDFFVLCSTLGSILHHAKFGQVGYIAANEYLDAYAYYRTRSDGTFTTAINWSNWSEVGMSVEALNRWSQTADANRGPDMVSNALSPAEGMEVFRRVLDYSFPRLVISTQDLTSAIAYYNTSFTQNILGMMEGSTGTRSSHGRPELGTAYVAPENDLQQRLAQIWEELLGIQPVGIYDNFFDLGGHSLLATQVMSRIKQNFEVDLPVRSLFEEATVAQLAQIIVDKKLEAVENAELLELLAQMEHQAGLNRDESI